MGLIDPSPLSSYHGNTELARGLLSIFSCTLALWLSL